jgi:hypothetical protein
LFLEEVISLLPQVVGDFVGKVTSVGEYIIVLLFSRKSLLDIISHVLRLLYNRVVGHLQESNDLLLLVQDSLVERDFLPDLLRVEEQSPGTLCQFRGNLKEERHPLDIHGRLISVVSCPIGLDGLVLPKVDKLPIGLDLYQVTLSTIHTRDSNGKHMVKVFRTGSLVKAHFEFLAKSDMGS